MCEKIVDIRRDQLEQKKKTPKRNTKEVSITIGPEKQRKREKKEFKSSDV